MVQPLTNREFVARAAIAVALAASATVLIAMLWFAGDVFLVLFAGILFAIFLHGFASTIARCFHLPQIAALIIVVVLLCCITVGGFTLIAGNVAQQVDQLTSRLPQSETALKKQLIRYEWGRSLLSNAPEPQQIFSAAAGQKIWNRISGVFSTTLGMLANGIIIMFVGLYLAFTPERYTKAVVQLFPKSSRPTVQKLLGAMGVKLWYWLLGRILAMAVVFAGTSLGLWLLGIPAALTLGLLAGVLNFIPNIGPLVSVIPAALIALAVGPMQVAYVGLLYLAIQIVESYILTPLVQERSVHLAPALTISMQVILGVLMGVAGLALATPLTAAVVVLVQELYLKRLEESEGLIAPLHSS